ncbi:hypothetical protein [Leisingera methylohalidivorans]|uniref:Uncharacterized protein n=1 Tax=Leisingera methylohalidivorans DSM 14336 TaxID=999552 RepID=V9W1L1_9RHOB|nr:hypothetical protein [Leisingera methylohalidivorans]AHD03062.1 hypothetical protein METH_10020 [Leisingera methylohalidivorans DSM 14336]
MVPDIIYTNIIVNPKMFRQLGQIGWAMWHALEMEARRACYALKFSDRINFIEARLEKATKPEGAARRLTALGHLADPVLPPNKKSATRNASDVAEALTEEIRPLFEPVEFRPGCNGVNLYQFRKTPGFSDPAPQRGLTPNARRFRHPRTLPLPAPSRTRPARVALDLGAFSASFRTG